MWKGEILQTNTSIDMQIHLFRRHISFKCSSYITNTWYLQKNEKWHKNDMTYRRKGLSFSKLDMDKHFFRFVHFTYFMSRGTKYGFLMYE